MSMIDSLLKNADPIVASALDRALSAKDISIDEAVKIFDSTGLEMNLVSNGGRRAPQEDRGRQCNIRGQQEHQLYKRLHQAVRLLCFQQGLSRRGRLLSAYRGNSEKGKGSGKPWRHRGVYTGWPATQDGRPHLH